MLAVATYDGVIALYDTKGNSPGSAYIKVPILDSTQTEEHGASQVKHKDPVWDLEWVDRGDERGECLVSISTDGLVIQWTVKKKFEATELMKLKKLATNNNLLQNSKAPSKKAEPSISRLAGGLCLQFSKLDSSMY